VGFGIGVAGLTSFGMLVFMRYAARLKPSKLRALAALFLVNLLCVMLAV
jgi:hypothetical protein